MIGGMMPVRGGILAVNSGRRRLNRGPRGAEAKCGARALCRGNRRREGGRI